MDNMQWRGRARIVAIVDMVLTILGLLVVVLAAFGIGFLTAASNEKNFGLDSEQMTAEDAKKLAEAQELLKNSMWILWVMLGVAVIVSMIQMWAAVKLMNATNLDNQMHNALRQATFWRNVTVVFLIFSVVGGALQGAWISGVFTLLIRGLFLYIVHQFMAELEQRLTTPNPNYGPTGVTVVKN